MPIYDFICEECDDHFDKLVSFDWKTAGVQCPSCGSDKVRQSVSLVGGFKSGNSIQTLDGKSVCTTCGGGTCST